MNDFNGRIGRIIRAFGKYPAGDLNTRMVVREALAAERREGFESGYSEGIGDACDAHRSERERQKDNAIGPPLDEDGHHPEGDYDLWHLAVYIPAVPCGSEAAVEELLAGQGIQVYRMWPVEDTKQMKAAMDEFEASLKAEDGNDGN